MISNEALQKYLASKLDSKEAASAERLSIVQKTEELHSVGDLLHNVSKLIHEVKDGKSTFDDLMRAGDKLMEGKKVIQANASNLSGFKRSGRAHGKLRKERKRQVMATVRHDHSLKKKTRVMQEISTYASGALSTLTSAGKNASPVPTKVHGRGGKLRAPRPQSGYVYTPAETIDIILNAEKSGWKRSDISSLKKEMIQKLYIPIKMTALNVKLKKHRDGIIPPPQEWHDDIGRPSRGGTLAELREKFDKAVSERPGMTWGRDEVARAMYEIEAEKLRRIGIDPSSMPPPHRDTISSNLTALAAMQGVSAATALKKNVHREYSEISVRNFLTNIAGQLNVQVIAGDAPVGRELPANAPDGVRVGLKLVAAALGVSEDQLYYVARENLNSTDDMALFFYLANNMDTDGDVRIARKEDMGNSFAVHDRGSTGDKYNGIKCRLTNTINGGGFMAPICLVFPGFTAEELPKDTVESGFVVMKVRGLTPDGDINAHSQQVGYAVLMRSSEPGVEEAFFTWYEKNIRMPFTDAVRERQGHKGGLVDESMRVVLMKDGGVPQMNATMSEPLMVERMIRKEVDLKHAKNTSTVAQACDTGRAHCNIRRNVRKLSADDAITASLAPHVDAELKRLEDVYNINIRAGKRGCIKGLIERIPNAIRKSCSERVIVNSFAVPGQIDRKTLAGYNVYEAFGMLKRAWTIQEAAKWLKDLPVLIREMHDKGFISEATFKRLGYPLDRDLDGKEWPLTASVTTQHSRQRCTCPSTPHLRVLIQCLIGVAQQKGLDAIANDKKARMLILELNRECEHILMRKLGLPLDSSRSFLVGAILEQFFDKGNKGIGNKHLKSFILARTCESPRERGSKLPSAKGTLENGRLAVSKRAVDPNAELDSKEDSLLFRAFQLRNVRELKLSECPPVKVLDETDTHPDPIVVKVGFRRSYARLPSAILRDSVWQKAKDDFVGTKFCEWTEKLGMQADALLPIIEGRFQRQKDFRIPRKDRHNHWVLSAFEDNLPVLCALVTQAQQIKADLACAKSDSCLLLSPSRGGFELASEGRNSFLKGCYLYYDPVNQEVWIRSGKLYGGEDRGFGDRNSEHEKGSKCRSLKDLKSLFYTYYTHKTEGHGADDLRRGYFEDLVMYVGLAFSESNGIEHLLDEREGVFVWSERTLKKLRETNAKGMSTKEKKMHLVSYMLELMYDLLLAPSKNVSVSFGFELFLGMFS